MKFKINKIILIALLGVILTGCSQDPPGGQDCIDKNNLFENLNNANLKTSVNSTGWVNANISVDQGKLLRIRTISGAISERTKKYRVIYRLDPRFPDPVIYIASYNYDSQLYAPDWYDVLNEPSSNSFNHKKDDSVAYVVGSVAGTRAIKVANGDAVNIKLLTPAEFYTNFTSVVSDYNVTNEDDIDLTQLYTGTGGVDNRVIAGSLDLFCPSNPTKCTNTNPFGATALWQPDSRKKFYAGINTIVNTPASLPVCSASVPTTQCAYDLGYGMRIKVNNTTFKQAPQKFISTAGKSIFYFQSNLNGNISFESSFDNSYFTDANGAGLPSRFMNQWTYSNATQLTSVLNDYFIAPRLAIGRYLMEIEIGSSTGQALEEKVRNVIYKFGIKEGNGPIIDRGSFTTPLFEVNSPATGNLYIKVENSFPELQGNAIFNIETYTGFNNVSMVLEDYLINPLKEQLHSTAGLFYGILVGTGAFIKLVYASLTLYVIIYGLCFLMGMIQMTAQDLFYRTVKIVFVSALFAPTSWTFFNTYLFDIFFNAADQLIRMATNTTSTVGYTFGFIDPILNKYTQARFWQIMYVYAVHISSGFTFIAVIIVWGVLNFLKALIEILVGYLLAMVSLSVVVALAPFFITAILFERSRMLFDNWLGIMFGLVMQPTIIMILFLLADQMASDMLTSSIVDCCWGTYYTAYFHMAIGSINVDYEIFTIRYYIPNRDGGMIELTTALTSGLVFFSISKLAKGLVDFAQTITDALTGQAASAGSPRAGNVIGSMMDDAHKVAWKYNPATKIAAKAGNEVIVKPIKRKIAQFNKFMKKEVVGRATKSVKEGVTESLNTAGKKINEGAKFVKREVVDKAATSMYEGLEVERRSKMVKGDLRRAGTEISATAKKGYDATIGRAATSMYEGLEVERRSKMVKDDLSHARDEIRAGIKEGYDATVGEAKRSITAGLSDENNKVVQSAREKAVKAQENLSAGAAKVKAGYDATVGKAAKTAYEGLEVERRSKMVKDDLHRAGTEISAKAKQAYTTSKGLIKTAREGIETLQKAPDEIQREARDRFVNPLQERVNNLRRVVDEAGKKFDEEWTARKQAAPAATQTLEGTDVSGAADIVSTSIKKSKGFGERASEAIREGFDRVGKPLDQLTGNTGATELGEAAKKAVRGRFEGLGSQVEDAMASASERIEPVARPLRGVVKAIKDTPEAVGRSIDERIASLRKPKGPSANKPGSSSSGTPGSDDDTSS